MAAPRRNSDFWNRTPLHALADFVENLDFPETIRLLTLFLAIVFGVEHWLFEIVGRLGFLLFLLRPRLLRRPEFWLTLAVAGTVGVILHWEVTDNHKYLLVYWLWVLFVAHVFVSPEQQERIIRGNARFFLCLIFLTASAQKLSSPSYRSGEMFEHLLYVDSRFAAFGKLVGVDPSVPDAVKKRIALFRSPFAQVEGNELEIPGSDRARAVALLLTWWDVSLQLLIGSLLLFRRAVTDKFAHILLLFFVLTTYLPAPVFGFGWILAIMGFTFAKGKFPKLAAAYIICFALILVYQVPWREWVLAG